MLECKRQTVSDHNSSLSTPYSGELKRVYGRMHGQTDRQMHNQHNAMTIARWPLASGAKYQGLFGKGLRFGGLYSS